MIPSLKSIPLIKPFTYDIEQTLFRQAREIDVFNSLMEKEFRVHNNYRETLIHQVLPFSHYMVHKYRKWARGHTYDDFLATANETCVIAYNQFDETRGFRWTSYVGRAVLNNLAKFSKADKIIKCPKDRVRTHRLPKDFDFEDVKQYTDPLELVDLVQQCFTDLSDARGKEILLRRLDESLQEIGDSLGLCRERIRQIESKSLSELENALRERGVGGNLY